MNELVKTSHHARSNISNQRNHDTNTAASASSYTAFGCVSNPQNTPVAPSWPSTLDGAHGASSVDRRCLRGAWPQRPQQAHGSIRATEACEEGSIWRSGREAVLVRLVSPAVLSDVQIQLVLRAPLRSYRDLSLNLLQGPCR